MAPGTRRTSRFVPMRDGTRIAIDAWLPRGAGSRSPCPTILHQTRYFRAVRWKAPARILGLDTLLDVEGPIRSACLAAGYAWIDVDTRGSGASFGFRPCPWSPFEVHDGADLCDWIVSRPWSNGRIGSTGISYAGTAAEFLLVNRHPAVRAVVPQFSLFDAYTDVSFPGGLHLSWFTEAWSRFNRALDEHRFEAALGALGRINLQALRRPDGRAGRALPAAVIGLADRAGFERVVSTLARGLVDGAPPRGEPGAEPELARAVLDHADNVDVHASARRITFRDDAGLSHHIPDGTIDVFSPHTYVDTVRSSGAAVFSYSGWMDGAYGNGAIKRHRTLDGAGDRLILGPWDHGGVQNISPFDRRHPSGFDHASEIVRFFDRHLRPDGAGPRGDDPRVRYYTLGAEVWRSADVWPPPGTRDHRWHLAGGGRLVPEPPRSDGIAYRVDERAGTGPRSRWRSLIGVGAPLDYGDRRRADERLLTFTSEPLPADHEVTGHPVVRPPSLGRRSRRRGLRLPRGRGARGPGHLRDGGPAPGAPPTRAPRSGGLRCARPPAELPPGRRGAARPGRGGRARPRSAPDVVPLRARPPGPPRPRRRGPGPLRDSRGRGTRVDGARRPRSPLHPLPARGATVTS